MTTGVPGVELVQEHQVHAVGTLAGERQVFVAVAVDIRPLDAVVGLQCGDAVGRDFDESSAGVPEQDVAIADPTGDRAVHVEVDPAVVIEVGEGARIVARVWSMPHAFDTSSNRPCPRLSIRPFRP